MHAVFWLITQPANKFWLRNQDVSSAGVRFFGLERTDRSAGAEKDEAEWKAIRAKWEYSHIVRAVLACIAVIALAMAIAM